MEMIFIVAIVFFAIVVLLLHRAVLQMNGKNLSKKASTNARFYHWNWLLLIGGFATALFIGVLRWSGILAVV